MDADMGAHNREPSHLAQATAASLTTHEAVCAYRYGQLERRIGRLETLVWTCSGALIIGMATLTVTILFRTPYVINTLGH